MTQTLHLTHSFSHRQETSLSSHLKHGLALLSLPHTEMVSFIEKEYYKNPFLIKKEHLFTTPPYHPSYEEEEEDLLAHLWSQLPTISYNEEEKKFIYTIFQHLNEKGHLEINEEELLKKGVLSASKKRDLLFSLQHLPPIGCASFGPKDSLMIQAKYYYPDNENLYKLIENYPFFPKSPEQESNLNLLKTLNPYPGITIGHRTLGPGLFIEPDAYLTYNDTTPSIIIPHDNAIPYNFNTAYTPKKNSQELLNEKQKAKTLIRLLHMRKNTLFKVMESLCFHQQSFFSKGEQESHLIPLKLQDVAQTLGLHTSTISRAVNAKYLQTDKNIYPLSLFLKKGIKRRREGTNLTPEQLLCAIQHFITTEPQTKPYSDEQLAFFLSKQLRTPLSRRTIGRYRLILGLPPSKERKEAKI